MPPQGVQVVFLRADAEVGALWRDVKAFDGPSWLRMRTEAGSMPKKPNTSRMKPGKSATDRVLGSPRVVGISQVFPAASGNAGKIRCTISAVTWPNWW